jgi:hypothetical protein
VSNLFVRVRIKISTILTFISLAFIPAGTSGASSQRKIDFNREVRPILSENCFLCHGPDEKNRKSNLRLDLEEQAQRPAKSGEIAIVPGAPEKSQVVTRITSSDPDEQMPPVKTGKKLSSGQIQTLRSWIQQGAHYSRHWAYVSPARSDLPVVKESAWPRNGLDYFILARLEKEGLKHAPEADRYVLARRAALDLTGLPPSLAEVDQFVRDPSPNAYERYVDRMLAKESFGEHWARLWLDLARYADSAGYADDPLRTIWAYRDYVIKSFNNNKPFDQFTIEQLAGDLLEDPTEEQLIGTAFHRNTMTNNEGGTNDEEFRNAAVVDRVNTTMAVWMGTSMACAQCHTHKYDPITQEEYFKFMALLNNTEDADRTDETPVLKFFTKLQKTKRSKLESNIEDLEQTLTTPKPAFQPGFTKWEAGFPLDAQWQVLKPSKVFTAAEVENNLTEDGTAELIGGLQKITHTFEVPIKQGSFTGLRLDSLASSSQKESSNSNEGESLITHFTATLIPPNPDSVPARFIRIEIPGKEKILSLAEVQVFSGTENVALKGEATQSSTDYEAKASLAIDGNTDGTFDLKSTTHTKSSDAPWWELDLKKAASVNRIVIWNRTDNDLQKRLKEFRITALNEKREVLWERTEKESPNPKIDYALDGTRTIRFAALFPNSTQSKSDLSTLLSEKPDRKKGWSVIQNQAASLTFLLDHAESIPEGSKLKLVIDENSSKKNPGFASAKLSVTDQPGFTNYTQVDSQILSQLSQNDKSENGKNLLQYYLRNLAPELDSERNQLAGLQKQLENIKPFSVPVMHELAGDKRRKTHLQYRGNYADLGKEVSEAVPAVFQPASKPAPVNRLDLARWLVAPENPLTARVIANRFWEQIFGIGIVRTSEEFGSQGEPPSNPELLDWLALALLDENWDVKKFLKLLVTSASYRQSSQVTPELHERDPDNRLLARGPRFRMSAEMVRDQALYISGLLSPKMYGPSVKPPRPSSGLSAAFGSSVDWKTSDGEDRFRRALYTEWRRTSPYPSMTTFDAPNREVCTIRRTRTNTPLQALVTLNDPVYLEASQALGRRMFFEGKSLADKIRYGFRLCLARSPNDAELDRLTQLFNEAHSDYTQGEPEKAKKMATEPIGPLPEGSTTIEMAAWTTVANVLLNLDETLMKR